MLPTTGAIKVSQIGAEAKIALLQPIPFNHVDLRKLANKTPPLSQISAADFRGAAYGVGGGYGQAEFTNQTNLGLNAVATSNTITAYDAPAGGITMAIFSDWAASYSINGGAWTDKTVVGSLKYGDTLAVRLNTSAIASTPAFVEVHYSGLVHKFTATTGVVGVNTGIITLRSSSYSYVDAGVTRVQGMMQAFIGFGTPCPLYNQSANALYSGLFSADLNTPANYTLFSMVGGLSTDHNYSVNGMSIDTTATGSISTRYPVTRQYAGLYLGSPFYATTTASKITFSR